MSLEINHFSGITMVPMQHRRVLYHIQHMSSKTWHNKPLMKVYVSLYMLIKLLLLSAGNPQQRLLSDGQKTKRVLKTTNNNKNTKYPNNLPTEQQRLN